MEAEYISISTACHDLLTVINIVKQLSASVGFDTDFVSQVSNIHVRIHEDDVGALTLGNWKDGTSANDTLFQTLCNQVSFQQD